MKIIPAILTNDLNELTSLLEKAEKAVDRVQIDVIDGEFVGNKTIDPAVLKNLSTFLNFDFHLMVKEPINWIEKCLRDEASGKPENTRIIGQIEMMQSQKDFVHKIMLTKCQAGLAIDLDTPVEKINEEALKEIDLLLIMSVKAGWFGQEFDLSTWDKIKAAVELRKKINGKFKIVIDGGVTKELVHEMQNLGVDEVFVGRRIFDPDLEQNLKLFNNGQN